MLNAFVPRTYEGAMLLLFSSVYENQELTAYNTYIDIGKQLVGIARPSCMIPQYIRPDRWKMSVYGI